MLVSLYSLLCVTGPLHKMRCCAYPRKDVGREDCKSSDTSGRDSVAMPSELLGHDGVALIHDLISNQIHAAQQSSCSRVDNSIVQACVRYRLRTRRPALQISSCPRQGMRHDSWIQYTGAGAVCFLTVLDLQSLQRSMSSVTRSHSSRESALDSPPFQSMMSSRELSLLLAC